MNHELEEKCKNDLFLKATWGHAVEDIPIETSEGIFFFYNFYLYEY